LTPQVRFADMGYEVTGVLIKQQVSLFARQV